MMIIMLNDFNIDLINDFKQFIKSIVSFTSVLISKIKQNKETNPFKSF